MSNTFFSEFEKKLAEEGKVYSKARQHLSHAVSEIEGEFTFKELLDSVMRQKDKSDITRAAVFRIFEHMLRFELVEKLGTDELARYRAKEI